MVDSTVVLWGQAILYSIYALIVMLLIGWFALRVTHPGPAKVNPKAFYAFVGFLIVCGVSLHLATYNTIPWTATDLHGDASEAAATFDITVANHEFTLPSEVLEVPCGELVAFNVTSEDLTYGFGLFREDNSMVAQMQVVPGHENELLWTFEEDGILTIRSTEYSGPEGDQMILENAVHVTGCTS